MKKPSEEWEELRRKVLGLGESSVHKTHYPSLRLRLAELERFRALVEISSDLLFVVEYESGRILDVSASATERLGIDRESLLSRSFMDLVPAKTWDSTLILLEQLHSGLKRDGRFMTELSTSDTDRKLPVEIAVQCLTFHDSNIAIFAARDITERQKAEQRILKLNRLYQVITQVNKAIVKAEKRCALFEEVCRLCVDCGQFKAAWIGVFEESSDNLRQVAWAGGDSKMAQASGTPAEVPFVVAARRGHHYVCELTGEPFPSGFCSVPIKVRNSVLGVLVLYSDDPCFFDEEEIALLDGVAADISFALDALDLEEQRCHSEQIQQETLGKIEAILNASPLAIIALDVEGRVTAWNRASQEIFGWSADEIMGLPNPVVPESLRSEAKAIRTRVLLGEVYTGELRRHRKDGKLLDVSLSAAPLRNAERNTIGLMAMYADISERKRLEMQLWQAQKLESIGRMAGGLAHDFNNLLTVMNGHAELLLSRLGKSDPCWSNANEVLNAGMHAADLTHQLLAFSRQQVLQPKIISANAIISGMEGMLRRLVGEDVQLVTALDPTVGGVKVDPAQLQQVIMNLVVNARDASDAGGVITILTRNMKIAGLEATALASGPGEYVALSVSDTGEGMDEETQRHIFEPFFSTKPADKGTGLGLATVWGIVNQSGGHIRLESKPDLGTTFIILFPRVHEEVEPAESVHARPIPRGTGTILLVEDRDNVRQLTSEILTSCGYSVVQARDPAEAIELFQRRGTEFSLMISDVIMPGMSGPVLGEKVRLTRPDLKILYMSGHAGENVFGDRGLGRDAVFLQKPFSVMELAVAVQQILGVGVAEL